MVMTEMTVGQDSKTVAKSLEGTMPWLAPSGPAAEAPTALDRPLLRHDRLRAGGPARGRRLRG
ncbi:hypothetical protein [Kitasatospora sp. NPDC088134]|uniref:hypothetical protein n=1 Tax=Kitasatospora sp. NPDC088134 TaxID=3364071 RepID=UPI003826E0C0